MHSQRQGVELSDILRCVDCKHVHLMVDEAGVMKRVWMCLTVPVVEIWGERPQ